MGINGNQDYHNNEEIMPKQTTLAAVCGYTESLHCSLCNSGMNTTSLHIVREPDQPEIVVCVDCIARLVKDEQQRVTRPVIESGEGTPGTDG